MISDDFVNKMAHTHNQAIYALRKFYVPGISFNDLKETAIVFIDDNTDIGVFNRCLRKFHHNRKFSRNLI